MVDIGPRNLEPHSGDCSAEAESLQGMFLPGVWFTNHSFQELFPHVSSYSLVLGYPPLQTSDPFKRLL